MQGRERELTVQILGTRLSYKTKKRESSCPIKQNMRKQE